ncbi:MAG: hypothetical protein CVU39_20860 [Chloroflexi bacterium HGW-Chloroflexi-10]|nr:MAG: hypothetical protein CVU39_20860 [Chloroflexi bacterium HGW-Chloroflexi-10]
MMSVFVRILIGLFVIAHGVIHPVLAFAPQMGQNPPVSGTFWTHSWLLGNGPFVKGLIYALSGLTALVLLGAGLGFMGVFPVTITRSLWIAGAGSSLLLLLVCWHNWLFVGILLDIAMLAIPVFVKNGWFS